MVVVEVKPGLQSAPLAVDDEETEPDTELQAALARARRLRQAERAEEAQFKVPKVPHYFMDKARYPLKRRRAYQTDQER